MLNGINIDFEAIEYGRWFDLLGSSFLIACTANKIFRTAIVTAQKPLTISELCNILSDCILLDWNNVKSPTGENVEYTKSLASYALMTNDELRSFVDTVSTDSSRFVKVQNG